MATLFKRLWGCFLVLSLSVWAVACAPAAETEPAADLPSSDALTGSQTPDAYPPPPTVTPTLPPYPWPTITPGPTAPPEPTVPPTETIPPPATLPPTPVVTPVPTSAPPIISFPEGTTPQPFTLYWRDGGVIRSLRSDGETEPPIFLDPVREFSLYLTPEEAYFRSWGAVSPNGRHMALVLTEEPKPDLPTWTPYPAHIYLLEQQSRLLRLLVKYGADPVWSPDGKWLAYRSIETGGLQVADVGTGEVKAIYTADRENEHNVTSFTWSPDSRFLAVLDEVFYESTDLIIVDAERENVAVQLIDSSINWVNAPQWSPTNNQIAFLSGVGMRRGGIQLGVVNLDGNQQQLADGIVAGGGAPAWSPDGQWIAYAGTAVYEPLPAQIDLWLVNPTDETIHRLTTYDEKFGTDDNAQEINPIWSPDGTSLVFSKAQELWVLSLIDGSQRRLFEYPSSFDIGLLIGY